MLAEETWWHEDLVNSLLALASVWAVRFVQGRELGLPFDQCSREIEDNLRHQNCKLQCCSMCRRCRRPAIVRCSCTVTASALAPAVLGLDLGEAVAWLASIHRNRHHRNGTLRNCKRIHRCHSPANPLSNHIRASHLNFQHRFARGSRLHPTRKLHCCKVRRSCHHQFSSRNKIDRNPHDGASVMEPLAALGPPLYSEWSQAWGLVRELARALVWSCWILQLRAVAPHSSPIREACTWPATCQPIGH
mmetsp:Transcript_108148/g.187758  ORF Transcript_108148/g.187758 Transcript_108148/m.187758 type:complete len:247 (+) Transcript_108148:1819-2559(+)